MPVFAMFVWAIMAAGQVAEAPRAGVVVTTSGHSVLAMAGPALEPGAIVTLVTIDDPQQVQRVLVAGSLAESAAMASHATIGPYDDVTAESGSGVLPDFAVAVLGRLDVEPIGTAAGLRVGNSPASIRVRSCTSSEGLHLTLWDGEPLQSTRLWHEYYYLGYDVEPSCQEADYRDGG